MNSKAKPGFFNWDRFNDTGVARFTTSKLDGFGPGGIMWMRFFFALLSWAHVIHIIALESPGRTLPETLAHIYKFLSDITILFVALWFTFGWIISLNYYEWVTRGNHGFIPVGRVHKVFWVCWEVSWTLVLTVCALYWFLIYPAARGGDSFDYSLAIWSHGVQLVFLCVEAFVTRIPFQRSHFLFPCIFFALYALLLGILRLTSGEWLYDVAAMDQWSAALVYPGALLAMYGFFTIGARLTKWRDDVRNDELSELDQFIEDSKKAEEGDLNVVGSSEAHGKLWGWWCRYVGFIDSLAYNRCVLMVILSALVFFIVVGNALGNWLYLDAPAFRGDLKTPDNRWLYSADDFRTWLEAIGEDGRSAYTVNAWMDLLGFGWTFYIAVSLPVIWRSPERARYLHAFALLGWISDLIETGFQLGATTAYPDVGDFVLSVGSIGGAGKRIFYAIAFIADVYAIVEHDNGEEFHGELDQDGY